MIFYINRNWLGNVYVYYFNKLILNNVETTNYFLQNVPRGTLSTNYLLNN